MPRQPLLPILCRTRTAGAQIQVGTHALGQRPELEALIANCLMAWSPMEAEMALLLAHLLGVPGSGAVLAVFHSLRRSALQREVILKAARVTLESADRELLSAILNVHKSIETERNALAHGHFGIYTNLPDGLIWMETKVYVDYKARMELGNEAFTSEEADALYSNMYVCTEKPTLKKYLRTSKRLPTSGTHSPFTCGPLPRNALNYTTAYVAEGVFSKS
jgi:hypothetical protein